MTTKFFFAILLAATAGFSASVQAQQIVVGGATMSPRKNILENTVHSNDHTTLIKVVEYSGMVLELQNKGPFTIFAPVNAAFDALPESTASKLFEPSHKQQLQSVMRYHILPGKYDFKRLSKAIKAGKGEAIIKTLEGTELRFRMNGKNNITVIDNKGTMANISVYDVHQSNGIIQVIDRVLLPK
ncbi:MAG: fasciclin domain-containing protein [Bacteroidia bacterium]